VISQGPWDRETERQIAHEQVPSTVESDPRDADAPGQAHRGKDINPCRESHSDADTTQWLCASSSLIDNAQVSSG
jgi:hypothetical protein